MRRCSLWVAAVSGLVLAGVMAYRTLVSSSLLQVRRIEVSPLTRLDRREILQRVGVVPGEPILGIDLETIRRRVESHPGVEQARVHRLLPDTLVIRIRERRIVGRIHLDNGLYLMDQRGKLVPPMKAWSRAPLTDLVGLTRKDLRERPQVCVRLLQSASTLLASLRDFPQLRIREIGLDPALGIRLALSDMEAEILLGFGEFHARLSRLWRILYHLRKGGQAGKVTRIDLRYKNRAIVRFSSDRTGQRGKDSLRKPHRPGGDRLRALLPAGEGDHPGQKAVI